MGRAKLKLKPAQRRPPQSPQLPVTAGLASRDSGAVYLPFPAPAVASANQETSEKRGAAVEARVRARSPPPSASALLQEEKQACPDTNGFVEKRADVESLRAREEPMEKGLPRKLLVHGATECRDDERAGGLPRKTQLQVPGKNAERDAALSKLDLQSAFMGTNVNPTNEDAEFVCCFPSVLLTREDGSVVDVIAAIHYCSRLADAVIVPSSGSSQFDPLSPVLCIDVKSFGRIRLSGRLLGSYSTHVSSFSVSRLNGKDDADSSRTFRGAVLFDKVEWIGSQRENPAGVPLPLPVNIAVEAFECDGYVSEKKAQDSLASDLDKPSDDRLKSSKISDFPDSSALEGSSRSVHLVTPKSTEENKVRFRKPENSVPSLASSDGEEELLDISLVEPIYLEPEYPAALPNHATTGLYFPFNDNGDSPSDASDASTSSSKPTPPPSTRKRRHKFGTNDSDEDPDWSDEKEEEEVESVSASPPLMTPAKRKRGKVRRLDFIPSAGDRRPRQRNVGVSGKPQSWGNRERIHATHDEIVIDDSSGDETKRAANPTGDESGGNNGPGYEAADDSDDSVEILNVVTPQTNQGHGSTTKTRRRIGRPPPSSARSASDEDNDDVFAPLADFRRGKRRRRVVASDDDSSKDSASPLLCHSGGSSDEDTIADLVLSAPQRKIR